LPRTFFECRRFCRHPDMQTESVCIVRTSTPLPIAIGTAT